MNIYKAPNLIISPKRKVYGGGGRGGHSTMNPSTRTHTHTHTLSLSSLPPLSLPLPPPSIHTYIYHWDGKRCVFRADLKANVELERRSEIGQRPDTRICLVQRISDGMKECEGDGCQRKGAAVEKECRTSGGQTDMTDHRCLQI